MFKKEFAGSIVVNGSARKIAVSGDAMNRTTIRLDGVTVYDKTSLLGNRPIEFVPIPGKKGVLRWQRDAAMFFECDVTVDGKTSKLPRLAGSVQPMTPQRLDNQVRISGAAAMLFGIMSLVFNYYDLKNGRYWTSLGTEPFFILVGLAGLCFPRTLRSWKAKNSKPILATVAVLFVISALFIKNWLMAWMTQH
jgi:hypothetical protein